MRCPDEVTARVNAAMAEARATRPSTSAEDWQTLDGRERHGYRRGMAEALDRVAAALRGGDRMTLDGYFIARDGYGNVSLWREDGDHPVRVLTQHTLRYDPALWEFLVAATKEPS